MANAQPKTSTGTSAVSSLFRFHNKDPEALVTILTLFCRELGKARRYHH
jgi:hypothetical protein